MGGGGGGGGGGAPSLPLLDPVKQTASRQFRICTNLIDLLYTASNHFNPVPIETALKWFEAVYCLKGTEAIRTPFCGQFFLQIRAVILV